MGDTSAISWTDATFNPWWGCEKVSPACAHCYAERDSNRYGQRGLWGSDHKIRFLSDANWQKPMLWAAHARNGLLPDGKTPLPEDAYGRPRRPRVFTASMADVFEDRPDLLLPRHRLLNLIEKTEELDWLVLTKRPEVALAWFDGQYVPPNVWMGVSIENEAWTWRADVLREIPAACRFLSCEPLLGSLFPGNPDYHPSIRHLDRPMTDMLGGAPVRSGAKDDPVSQYGLTQRPDRGGTRPSSDEGPGARDRAPLDLHRIDWVIIGGESGPRGKARPTHPDWVREIRDAVLAIGREDDPQQFAPWTRPALHFKQWGSWTLDPHGLDPNAVWVKPDGTRVTDMQADVYDIDLTRAYRMRYAGPRPGDGGKHLDGVDWCEFPEPEMVAA